MKKSKIVKILVVAILAIFIVSVLLYSAIWPPVSVVESKSMTHSDYWTAGTINVGDMVFVKKATTVPGNIVTYVVGRDTGYKTYGDYGNVVLYKSTVGTVIIHRAMFYLSWNNSMPVVQGYHNQTWLKVTKYYVQIDNVGYAHKNLGVNISAFVNESGIFTCGDFNLANSGLGTSWNSSVYVAADQNIGITGKPVNSTNIVGIAFWDIPWFGLIKLNILRLYNAWPQYNEVALNSYYYLFAALTAILVLVFFPYESYLEKRKSNRDRKRKRL